MQRFIIAAGSLLLVAGCKQAPSGQAPVTVAEAGQIAATA